MRSLPQQCLTVVTCLCIVLTTTRQVPTARAFSALSPPKEGSSSSPVQDGFLNVNENTAAPPASSSSSSSSVVGLPVPVGKVLSETMESTTTSQLPEPTTPTRSAIRRPAARAAIVLNTNARSVSTDLVPIAESIFGKEYVYVTTTEEEGRQAAVAMMTQQNISMVIPVGGDGTLSSLINFLCDSIRHNHDHVLSIEEAMKELPLVAYLPLGTGNGVGSVVGSEMLSDPQPWKVVGKRRRKLSQIKDILQSFHDISQRLVEDPNYLMTDPNAPDVVEIPMMEVSYPQQQQQQQQDDDDGDKNGENHEDNNETPTQQPPTTTTTLCFFAGAGFDSLMLQDFQSVKKWAIRTKILTKTLSSVAGYCVALIVKTLPKCVARREHNIRVTLTTRDPDALWVDHRRGDVVQKVGPTQQARQQQQHQTLLYQGTTGILAAGTSPFYGGGLRLFPFARLTTDKMHLRLGRIHPLRGFFNIPQIFEGSFRDKRSGSFGCLDYIGGDFDVHVSSSSSRSTPPPIAADSSPSSSNQQQQQKRKGFPVQHSGESVGYFERFRLRVVKEPVRFVTLMRRRVVKEEDEPSSSS